MAECPQCGQVMTDIEIMRGLFLDSRRWREAAGCAHGLVKLALVGLRRWLLRAMLA
jgi:hypothetical protein